MSCVEEKHPLACSACKSVWYHDLAHRQLTRADLLNGFFHTVELIERRVALDDLVLLEGNMRPNILNLEKAVSLNSKLQFMDIYGHWLMTD